VFDARAVSSPYIADGIMYGSCGDGPTGHQFAAIRPSEDGKSAEPVYIFKKMVPYVPTSIVVNGLLFYVTDNGVMRCLKAATGDVVWTQRMDGTSSASIVCAKDKLFMLSKEGHVRRGRFRSFPAARKERIEDRRRSDPHPPLSTRRDFG